MVIVWHYQVGWLGKPDIPSFQWNCVGSIHFKVSGSQLVKQKKNLLIPFILSPTHTGNDKLILLLWNCIFESSYELVE